MIGAIVLAAGSSRRFGGDKRRATLPNGKLVVEQTVRNALAVFDEVLLVLRASDESFATELAQLVDHQNLQTFCAPDSARGMGHSLANSIGNISHWDAAFVLLADMPFVTHATFESLIQAMQTHDSQAPIVVPFCDGERGQPVGFSSDYFDEMTKLTGDSGARLLLKQHKDKLVRVDIIDRGILMDIDTPDDIRSD